MKTNAFRGYIDFQLFSMNKSMAKKFKENRVEYKIMQGIAHE
jgi:hypothetical protein